MIQTEFLVFQAKSFYNAYIALEQLNQSCEPPLLYYVPMIVNGAFSIEISLKALLAINHIEYVQIPADRCDHSANIGVSVPEQTARNSGKTA